MLKSPFAFSLFTFAVVAALVVPALFMDGMFADGILYASVSKNLANGFGTFWHPHFTVFVHDHFHEQPPLTFALQSLFFRIFGNNIYPERIYDLVMAILNAWLIAKIWKQLLKGNDLFAQHFWLPILLFFISPMTFWSFDNNTIEITMSVFVLASVSAFISVFTNEKNVVLHAALGILFLVAASLCKGFQGLFPLAVPFLFCICRWNVSWRRATFLTALILFFLALFYALVLLSPSVREAYTSWFDGRMVSTFKGLNDTSGSHFHLLFELFLDLLPALSLLAIVFSLSRIFHFRNETQQLKRPIIFMLLLALCGSLPLMVTKEQRGFYLLTSFPFYSIAIALMIISPISAFCKKLENKKTLSFLSFVGFLLLIGVVIITFVNAGKPKRDAEWLADIRTTGNIIGSNNTVSSDDFIFNNWGVMNYYSRLYNISLTTQTDIRGADYFISSNENAPSGYVSIPLSTNRIHLWKKGK